MSNNAQWAVRFLVMLPDYGMEGIEIDKTIYLSSPDLVNTKEAKRRATKTARERLHKQLIKDYGPKVKFKAVHTETRCVG